MIERDKNGIRLKFPKRDCRKCARYPCFNGIERCVCNFAQYGCIRYKNNGSTGSISR